MTNAFAAGLASCITRRKASRSPAELLETTSNTETQTHTVNVVANVWPLHDEGSWHAPSRSSVIYNNEGCRGHAMCCRQWASRRRPCNGCLSCLLIGVSKHGLTIAQPRCDALRFLQLDVGGQIKFGGIRRRRRCSLGWLHVTFTFQLRSGLLVLAPVIRGRRGGSDMLRF